MKISRTRAVTLLVVVFVLALGTAHAGRRSGGSSKSSGGSKSKSRTSGSSGTSSHSGGSYQHKERNKQSGSSVEVKTGYRSGGKINNAFIHSESKSPSSDLSSFLSRLDSYSQHSKQKPPKTTHNSKSIGYHTQRVKIATPPKSPILRSNASSRHDTSTGNSFYNKTASHGTQGFNYSSSSVSKVSPLASNSPSAPGEVSSIGNQPVGWNVPTNPQNQPVGWNVPANPQNQPVGWNVPANPQNQPIGWNVPANPQNQPVGWNVPANPQTHQGLPNQQNVLLQKPSAPELPLNSNAWANPNYPPQNPPPQNAYPGSVPNPQPGWNVQPQYPQHIPQGNPGQGTYPAGQAAYPGQVPYQGNNGYPSAGEHGSYPGSGYNLPGGMSYPGKYGSNGGNYSGKPSGGTKGMGKAGAAAAGVAGGTVIESPIQKALGATKKRSKGRFHGRKHKHHRGRHHGRSGGRYITSTIQPSVDYSSVSQPVSEVSSDGYGYTTLTPLVTTINAH